MHQIKDILLDLGLGEHLAVYEADGFYALIDTVEPCVAEEILLAVEQPSFKGMLKINQLIGKINSL